MFIKNWNIEEQTGYKPLTTSYMDLSIAEKFGIKSIKDTIDDLRKNFNGNYKYETELVMALNWKIWEHYGHNEALAQLYNELWEMLDHWYGEHYANNKEALTYFGRTTD